MPLIFWLGTQSREEDRSMVFSGESSSNEGVGEESTVWPRVWKDFCNSFVVNINTKFLKF